MTEEITLKSGKVISPNRGILGIGPSWRHPGEYDLFEGYDSEIDLSSRLPEHMRYSTPMQITDDEAIELAEYAIKMWENFIEKVRAGK